MFLSLGANKFIITPCVCIFAYFKILEVVILYTVISFKNMKNLIALLLFLASPVYAESSKPNFLFILADDLGIMDMSIEGSSFYETPHIDSIARSGMRFTDGYSTCQVCSPSRASIMTGKYPANHGITEYIGAPFGKAWKRNTKVLPAKYVKNLAHEDITIAEAMKEGGYKTFFAGKWHLGSEGSWPTDHGFDINIGGWDAGGPRGGFFGPFKIPTLENKAAGESMPLRLAQETADFIKANKDQPFFAYLSFYSVHAPVQTTKELWGKYQKKAMDAGLTEATFIHDRTKPVRQVQNHPVYAGMMESMDNAVGIVLKQLEELGLDENTVVIFTSDNGGVSSGDAEATACLPFRGGKGRQWEGGIRQPFYISVPGITTAGQKNTTPATGADFYPTILALAGLPLMPEQHTDGVSLLPLLKGGSIEDRDLFWHYPHYGNQGGEPSGIIRSGDWKLIHYYEDGHDELYNIKSDIGEQNDLAATEVGKAKELRTKLDTWLKETGAKMPEANEKFNEVAHGKWLNDMKGGYLQRTMRNHQRFLKPDFDPKNKWWGSMVAED